MQPTIPACVPTLSGDFEKPPETLRIIGRLPLQENGDIVGEYSLQKCVDGYPVYQSSTTGIAIGYYAPLDRWVIDRSGFRNPGTCVAYASATPRLHHPANPELVWYIWDSKAQAHVLDSEVMAFDAPDCFTFVSRDPSRENSVVNGKYHLSGALHGRVMYRHQQEDLILRFSAPENRWLIQRTTHPDHICCAWADAGSSWHPGDVGQWNFWDTEKHSFIIDSNAGLLNAPAVVHILGRRPQSENARINGTYHLAGVHGRRPLYVQPGTQSVIRYSSKHGMWLVDCDGLEKPSLLSRLFHWALTGDSEIAYDRCCAWAYAEGSHHPGNAILHWHVWETSASQHKLDREVMATSAPLSIEVSRVTASRENDDVIGEYRFVGCYNRALAYQKQGSPASIYFSKSGKWIIDRHGMHDSGTCVAYLDCTIALDHPANTCNSWYVWQASRAKFVLDPAIFSTSCSDVAASVTNPGSNSFLHAKPTIAEREGGFTSLSARFGA